jgi:aminopeptidase
MFTSRQLENYADVLLWGMQKARTKAFKKGDIVLVRFNQRAIKLAELVQIRLIDRGLQTMLRMLATDRMEYNFFSRADNNQLAFIAPGEHEMVKNLNGTIFLNAPESLTHLQTIDSRRITTAMIARKPLRDILTRREENGLFGWTLCSLTTPQLARHARMSQKNYTEQIVKACYLNARNAVSRWEEIFRNAREIKQWLNSMRINGYHVESARVDLCVGHGQQRRWIGISGHNIPSFELFISPDWRQTEGVFFANQPSYRNGNLVRDVRLEFKNGSVCAVDAKQGREFIQEQVGMDAGAARLGEFSLTDTRFSKIDRFMADTLFDENFGGRYGNCHIALGSSYSDTFRGKPALLTKKRKQQLGFNDSALHWDLVNTEKKTVTAHLAGGRRQIIYENGRFKV